MKIAGQTLVANKLLAALPDVESQRVQKNLEPVTLRFGEVLYEPGDRIKYVYFPSDVLVSLLTLVDRHLALEVGMVGWEGMVGVSCALGVGVTPFRALVQGTGTALRMEAESFRKEFQSGHCLQREVHLYTHRLMAQLAQTGACNRFHFIEARLARWLLMTRDRVNSDHFHLTHEFLGDMLGVRRVGVTKAAHALKQRDLIDYSRGNMTVVDGPGLEAAACSCYAVDKASYEFPQKRLGNGIAVAEPGTSDAHKRENEHPG
ncbi:MAG: Crp/Fnr family transcriptional regulator [Sterolibacterium sp.]|jgi:CRP-like cAMP-binding protein